jgi:hypothetical protein
VIVTVGLIHTETGGHNREQNRVDGVFFANNGNYTGVPCLGQELGILTRYEYDPLRVRQGEGQPFECGLIEDEYARLRRVRPVNRFDMPCATVGQRFVNRCGISAVGDRELNRLHHGRLHSSA